MPLAGQELSSISILGGGGRGSTGRAVGADRTALACTILSSRLLQAERGWGSCLTMRGRVAKPPPAFATAAITNRTAQRFTQTLLHRLHPSWRATLVRELTDPCGIERYRFATR